MYVFVYVIKVEFEKLMDIVEWVGQSTKKTLKGDKFSNNM